MGSSFCLRSAGGIGLKSFIVKSVGATVGCPLKFRREAVKTSAATPARQIPKSTVFMLVSRRSGTIPYKNSTCKQFRNAVQGIRLTADAEHWARQAVLSRRDF